MFVLARGHRSRSSTPDRPDGVFSLLWLVIALPALGALILLVGGPLAKGDSTSAGTCSARAMPLGVVR